jgi:hypothetical protein
MIPTDATFERVSTLSGAAALGLAPSEPPQLLRAIREDRAQRTSMTGHSVLGRTPAVDMSHPLTYRVMADVLSGAMGRADPVLDRAIGCILGLAIGDATGAPAEFAPVRYPGPTTHHSPLTLGIDRPLPAASVANNNKFR